MFCCPESRRMTLTLPHYTTLSFRNPEASNLEALRAESEHQSGLKMKC